MPALLGLFTICSLSFVVTLILPEYQDFQILGASLVAASLFLLVRGWIGGRGKQDKADQRLDFVIDGSNVMHWMDNNPQIQPLLDVVAELSRLGYRAGVIFDANAGYKLWGRYQDDFRFARQLGLHADQVLVVGKGQPADPVILAAARENGARVITNDRYRDWAEQFPEIAAPDHLIRGGYRNGKLWINERAFAKPFAPATGTATAR